MARQLLFTTNSANHMPTMRAANFELTRMHIEVVAKEKKIDFCVCLGVHVNSVGWFVLTKAVGAGVIQFCMLNLSKSM